MDTSNSSTPIMCSFMLAWNAGLGLPKGYAKSYKGREKTECGSSIRKYTQTSRWFMDQENNARILYNQFENKNIEKNESNKIYFIYNNEIFFLTKANPPSESYNIYDEEGMVKIGALKTQTKEENYELSSNRYYYIFFDDQYLYYVFLKQLSRYYFEIPLVDSVTHSRTYYKREYYRLNLDTGQNEEINKNQFLEKVNNYDQTVEIN